ncbi:MAG: DNA recombination protein RmuC [Parcubacteria group bacterium]
MDPYLMLVLGLVAGAIIVFVFVRSSKKKDDLDTAVISQRLDGLNNSVNQALRDTMKMVSAQLKDTRESSERATHNVHKQVEGFTAGLTKLTEGVAAVRDSVKDVSSFQDIFKSPKLRGMWGEASLEASLEQYFAREGYSIQYYFKSGEAVDAVIRLPNDLLLPVDSKFNWENFEKMVNEEAEIDRERYRKIFFSDVKKKVDEIAGKYILPSEGTTDLALMFIPAETVYYEIIHNIKEMDIPDYARKKKVFLVSPNTFGMSVSAIRHWLKDIQFSKQTKDIMKRLERIVIDSNKLADSFRKLGKHLSDTRSAYDDSEKRLELMTDRVQNVVETGEVERAEQLVAVDREEKS